MSLSENARKEINSFLNEILNPETLLEVQKYVSEEIYRRIWNTDISASQDTIDSVLVKTVQRIEDMGNKNEDITGVPSGFAHLDRVTYGWQQGDLIIIASRPSIGKTTFALNLARNAALHHRKPTSVAVFSLEISASQLMQRILSAESEIMLEKIARGRIEEYEMEQLYRRGIQRLNAANLIFEGSVSLNIRQLKVKCRDFKTRYDIGLIIIDYLQLIEGLQDDQNREKDLSRATRELKSLARELQIPIIVLSQISHEVEKRRDSSKIPQLSDLRDSGAIEENADIICFLHRPEYYEINQNGFGEDARGVTHLRIAKHRNGLLENLKFKARFEIQKFFEDNGDDFDMPLNWKPIIENGAKFFFSTEEVNNLSKDDYPF